MFFRGVGIPPTSSDNSVKTYSNIVEIDSYVHVKIVSLGFVSGQFRFKYGKNRLINTAKTHSNWLIAYNWQLEMV